MRALVLILYLINSGLYLWFSPELKDQYPNEFAAWYFGSEGLFTAWLLYLAVDCPTWIDKQFIFVTSGFILFRSILYILNYTLLFTVSARMRMMYLALYSLCIVLPTFISAYRHGHFRN